LLPGQQSMLAYSCLSQCGLDVDVYALPILYQVYNDQGDGDNRDVCVPRSPPAPVES